ncbi:hypothetical protein Dimus_019543 [Dionaea muscipula]
MKVVRGGYQGKMVNRQLHIGFITMEPRSLFIPQYLDSGLIIFLRRGEAKIGLIYKEDFVERRLRMGDIYTIPAGSPFYIVNVGEGQRLHIICGIDTSQGLGIDPFQSFFVAGGANTVLDGFDPQTLSTAFNELVPEEEEEDGEELEQEQPPQWSLRKTLRTLLLGKEKARGRDYRGRRKGGPDAYNLYDRNPDFRNNYGWSLALDRHDYHPLKKFNLGVYYVNLSAVITLLLLYIKLSA